MEFIQSLTDEKKRADSLKLVEIMSELTGEKPYMYGPTIVGFGNYHYKYESGHEGDAPIAGFSPRKAAFSIYLGNFPGRKEMMKDLGKHKEAVACLYVNKLADINLPVLKKIIKACIAHTKKTYPS